MLSSPLIAAPTGTTPYCLSITVDYLGDDSAMPDWHPTYGVGASTASGTYWGIGVATSAIKQPRSGKIGG